MLFTACPVVATGLFLSPPRWVAPRLQRSAHLAEQTKAAAAKVPTRGQKSWLRPAIGLASGKFGPKRLQNLQEFVLVSCNSPARGSRSPTDEVRMERWSPEKGLVCIQIFSRLGQGGGV